MEKLLTKNNSTVLKGVAAIFIMLGHIGINTAYPILYPFRKAGFLWVGLFFFMSGYGLMFSHLTKPDYIKKAFLKRLVSIIVPTYLIYLIFQIVIWFILKMPGDYWSDVIYRFGICFVQDTNWFIPEVIVFYILFFLLFRLFDSKIALIILWILTSVFIISAFIRRDIFSNPWYGSSLCFPLGITYAINEEKIQSLLTKKKIIMVVALMVCIGGCTGLFFILGNDSIIGNVISRNMASMSFCFLCLILVLLVNISNKFTVFLGEISFEIFLVHLQLLKILCSLEISRMWILILCLLLTVTISALIHKLFEIIKIAK